MLSVVAQMRMGSLLSLVPLEVSSSCRLREFFLATVATGLLIGDRLGTKLAHVLSRSNSVKLL